MTTGNTVASGVSSAGVVTDAPKSDCDELKEEVEKEDALIQKVRNSPKAAIAHKATTVSASKLKCGSTTIKTPAYSSLTRLPKKMRKRYAQGVKSGSNMCQKNGKPFKHAQTGFSSGCTHTEARFVEDIFGKHGPGGGGCELTIKIKWKQRVLIRDANKEVIGATEDPPLEIPCRDCEKVLCHAQFCGLKVHLCKTVNGQEQKEAPPNCKKRGY